MDWKGQQKEIVQEHERRGHDGRFGPKLPCVNDGALLFLLHMIAKFQPLQPEEKIYGSRCAIVFNGSPLFTGGAASGENEIRRWILENDWLEAIVALPEQMFYNTGIGTFIWVVTNHKTQERQGKIQLLDARERGLLAVIFDITRRLAIANPALDDPIAAGEAIILIDEVELHLHPGWQRQVLRRFTETFKNCQFIVTTHSPQVLGEVKSRCIRYLLHEDDKIISWTPPRAFGLDSSRVLEELMDVKARNAEIDNALGELFQVIDDEDFAAAEQRIEILQATLGENDPELTRARALMAFLKGVE